MLHDFGFSVLAIDYRGFGKSSGELPSEATVYEDAQIGDCTRKLAPAEAHAQEGRRFRDAASAQ